MKKKYLLACLLLCSVLTGCVSFTFAEEISLSPMDAEDLFSSRDRLFAWDERSVTEIALETESVLIDREGVYLISGRLENGQIVVDAPKDDKVQLVLMGASVHCESHAALYIRQADKVFVTLAPGTENSLSCGEKMVQTDENNVDAALFSKEDLTLNGEGSLFVGAASGHGVVSKDEMKITGGSYRVEAAGHGFEGKDHLCISDGTFCVTAGKDGFHAEHEEDETKGFVYLAGGVFDITAAQDGISASGGMEVSGGTYTLLCGGGYEQGETHAGQMPGGRGGMPPDGFGGGRGGFSRWNGENVMPENTEAESADISKKALKSGGNMLITGGTFVLDSADDGLHSNQSLQLSGGIFDILTGDDGIHAEETLTVNGGTVHIGNSYEGLEALHIRIKGGNMTMSCDDDGLNAAGGTDESGFGGMFGGGDRFGGRGFGGMQAGNGSIIISEGTLSITAYGDGIDANGYFQMDGGYVTVCGPTFGDTATLDYDTTGEVNGGTFVGTGSSGMMAQTFSGGTQGKIAVQVGNAPAGTAFTLTDAQGKQVLSHSPALDYNVIIVSAPGMTIGENYTVSIGNASGTFAAQ